MTKKIVIAIVGLVALFALVFGAKAMQIQALMNLGASMVMPSPVVSTSKVEQQDWEVTLKAVGSLEAVQGVVVTADEPGRVESIHFKAGAQVKKGEILVSQDTSTEQAQLRAAEASVELAKADLTRIKELYRKKAASKSEYDSAQASHKSAVAQADNIRSIIDKKNLRAAFDGRLGIRRINVGQDLGSGDAIVSLQAVDPIFVNFFLPQKDLPKLDLGLEVRVNSSGVPDETFVGTITAINSEVDPVTRSVNVQATLENAEEKLMPGMFANVKVVMPEVERVLAVPATAIAYAAYGDSIFVVSETVDEKNGEKVVTATQQFVRLGESLGDYVSLEAGVNYGDVVVSSGVFKLQNGATISVNNDVKPEYEVHPSPEDT